MHRDASSWSRPTRATALWFVVRALGLQLRRWVQDRGADAPRRWPAIAATADWPVLAEQRSPLWAGAAGGEYALVAGKVHNLRVARLAFDGVEIPAGEVLSFWRQLGRPLRWRGFVLGREVREGCVVPVRGGGICQLSNALVRCALRAGLELVERHRHSAEPGAERLEGPDATVFWNYVDLRLRADHPWRVEVVMTADELIVRLRGRRAAAMPSLMPPVVVQRGVAADRPAARGCLSCNETACFRHQAHHPLAGIVDRGPVLLADAATPEFAQWLRERAAESVEALLPWHGPLTPARYRWTGVCVRGAARVATARRMLAARWPVADPGLRQRRVVEGQARLAAAYAMALRPTDRQLIVDQGLLPHLARLGALGGRQVTVLGTSMPMRWVQAELDRASRRWPDVASLRDFRVASELADIEWSALCAAQRVVTPHALLAAELTAIGEAPRPQVELLPWRAVVPVAAGDRSPQAVVLPAGAWARKGALELAVALRSFGRPLLVLGDGAEPFDLWHGLDVRRVDFRSDWPSRAAVVVLPAYVEHQPRLLIAALAAGIPVIATPACGLPDDGRWVRVPAGDVDALMLALGDVLSGCRQAV